MRLIDADAVVEQADKEREYLKTRGLLGAEHVLTKYLRNLVEDAPTVEMESPVIKINVPKEDIQKLLEELQKPQKVLVLPEPEVEPVRLYGEWIDKQYWFGHCSAECSNCGERADGKAEDTGFGYEYSFYNYCPNCGAKMGGNKENE